MKRVLVTGGAGFLGSHLCERLIADGCEVVCLDNFFTGRRENVDTLLDNHAFELVRHDVTEPMTLEVDEIYHLACPASPVHYQRNPVKTIRTGVMGTLNMLDVARDAGAKILIASTSEVYGDPEVHPQHEGYWGNVNPIGARACYDESKRCAEALAVSYARQYSVEVRIARIFNSILADESVVLFNDDEIHVEAIGDYAQRVGLSPELPRRVLVPAFNPRTHKMELRRASALIKHTAQSEAFELRLRYGRSVKVTGDHSVFVKNAAGVPEAKPVREIKVGDHVAIPSRLPVVERDRAHLNLAEEFAAIATADDLWTWAIRHPSLAKLIEKRREEVHRVLAESDHFKRTKNFRITLTSTSRKYMSEGKLPLYVLLRLGVKVPKNAEFGLYNGSANWLPNRIAITPELLWFAGFYLAEGCEFENRDVSFISLCSNTEYLARAAQILRRAFRVHVGKQPPTPGRGPTVYAHSKPLRHLMVRLLKLRDRRIPGWVMQLPLARAKHFLEGFRCGDGTHSGKKVGNELCFDTTSEQLALDLNLLLLRFGIVASFGQYETTFKKKYGERRFPFYRITVCKVDTFDILRWDRGVRQTLNAQRLGDLVWSMVRKVRPCLVSGNVYDFSVPGFENFVAGNGVCCHNTYGPRLAMDDGRVISNFIVQALRGEPLTLYGDGSQTRSFCYVSDLVDGFVRLMNSSLESQPINLGNPNEFTMRELAALVQRLCGGKSRIVHRPLPEDDPRQRRPDISRAKEFLGWEPKIELEQGLASTIGYFKLRI